MHFAVYVTVLSPLMGALSTHAFPFPTDGLDGQPDMMDPSALDARDAVQGHIALGARDVTATKANPSGGHEAGDGSQQQKTGAQADSDSPLEEAMGKLGIEKAQGGACHAKRTQTSGYAVLEPGESKELTAGGTGFRINTARGMGVIVWGEGFGRRAGQRRTLVVNIGDSMPPPGRSRLSVSEQVTMVTQWTAAEVQKIRVYVIPAHSPTPQLGQALTAGLQQLVRVIKVIHPVQELAPAGQSLSTEVSISPDGQVQMNGMCYVLEESGAVTAR